MEIDPVTRIRVYQELSHIIRHELPARFPGVFEQYSLTSSDIDWDRNNHHIVCASIQGRIIVNVAVDTVGKKYDFQTFPQVKELEPVREYIFQRLYDIFEEDA
jgi:hypothetical protein